MLIRSRFRPLPKIRSIDQNIDLLSPVVDRMSPIPRKEAIQLARSLPPRLLYFFQKWPTPATLGSQSSAAPNTIQTPSSSPPSSDSDAVTDSSAPLFLNRSPFDAFKNPATGKWHAPFYSLRRQADLMKLAQQHGVEELMPFSIKGSAEKARKREEHGLRVKGTGVGQKVKGKEWERTLKGR
jgi:large subunit ribosomal protein L25